MPIDASIYGNLQVPAPVNPLGIALQMSTLANQRQSALAIQADREAQTEQRRRAIADQQSYDSAVAVGGSRDDIIDRLPGHMQASAREALGKADDAAAKAREARSKADAADADYFGQLASSVKGFGYDPGAAALAIQHAKAGGHDVSPIVQQIQQFGLKPVVDNLIAASPAQRELVTKETDAGAKQTEATTGATRLQLETPKIQAEAKVAQQVAAGTVGGLTPDMQRQKAEAESRARLAWAQYNESKRRDDMQDPDSPRTQQRLEQQYRGVLQKELSSRSGGLGTEDQKVNQAIHLIALMEQNKDPKTGQYNIPKAQYAELANGVATLVSPNGRPTDAMRSEIETATAKGDLSSIGTYLTGRPFNGSTQDMYKMLRDSIDRQGRVAESNRGTYLNAIRSMAPTDLQQERRDRLEQSLKLNSVDNPIPAAGPNTIGRFQIVGVGK